MEQFSLNKESAFLTENEFRLDPCAVGLFLLPVDLSELQRANFQTTLFLKKKMF